jgi:hypothetical protein
MKKLLALSGIGSSVAFWAMSTVTPKLVAILLVFILDALNPSLGGSATAVNFATTTGSIASQLVGFLLSFFTAGGLTQNEVFVGL